MAGTEHPCTAQTAPDAACRMLRPALAYALQGWPVFPCNREKKPTTRHGFKDATTDRHAIVGWWTAEPGAMIGTPTGAASGIVAVDLDIDVAKGIDGVTSFARLVKAEGQRIRTRKHITPRGGCHLLFVHPGENVKCTVSAIAPGVDTRGDGGYIILPPSQSEGGTYTTETDASPAPLPAWLVTLFHAHGIMTSATDSGHELDWNAEIGGTREPEPLPPGCPPSVAALVSHGAPKGQRNDRALAVAVQMRDEGHDRGTVERYVLDFARNCTPPLPEREASAVVASAFTRPPRGPARNPCRPAAVGRTAPPPEPAVQTVAMPPTTFEDGTPAPHLCRLSAAAFDTWRAYHDATLAEIEAARETKAGGYLQWLSKLPEHMARLALLLRAVEGQPPGTIEQGHIEAAITLGEALKGHARRAFAMMGADIEAARARRVWAWIEKNRAKLRAWRESEGLPPVEAVKPRDLDRYEVAGVKNAREGEAVLMLLTEKGYLQAVDYTPPKGKGHRVFFVHPPDKPDTPDIRGDMSGMSGMSGTIVGNMADSEEGEIL